MYQTIIETASTIYDQTDKLGRARGINWNSGLSPGLENLNGLNCIFLDLIAFQKVHSLTSLTCSMPCFRLRRRCPACLKVLEVKGHVHI